MDGYVRFYTDLKGKFEDYEEVWGKDDYIEESLQNIEYFIGDMVYEANSLILILLNMHIETVYDYYSGSYDCDEEIEIMQTIVLVKDYFTDEEAPKEHTSLDITEEFLWEL